MQTTAALGVMVVLAGVSAPMVQQYMTHAKTIRAKREVQVIGSALVMFMADVGGRGVPVAPKSTSCLDLLVSGGGVPEVDAAAGMEWGLASNDSRVGTFDNYLVLNTPGFPEKASSPSGWDGPYISSGVESDPWGNRYACSVGWLYRGRYTPIILSAGPDGAVSTPYRFTTADSLKVYKDDIAFVLQ